MDTNAPIKTDIGEYLNGLVKGFAGIGVALLLWKCLPYVIILVPLFGTVIIAVLLATLPVLLGRKLWRSVQAKRQAVPDPELAALVAQLRAKGYGKHYSDPLTEALRQEMIEARSHQPKDPA